MFCIISPCFAISQSLGEKKSPVFPPLQQQPVLGSPSALSLGGHSLPSKIHSHPLSEAPAHYTTVPDPRPVLPACRTLAPGQSLPSLPCSFLSSILFQHSHKFPGQGDGHGQRIPQHRSPHTFPKRAGQEQAPPPQLRVLPSPAPVRSPSAQLRPHQSYSRSLLGKPMARESLGGDVSEEQE